MWRHSACSGARIAPPMATIQVKNVPDEVHAELRRRSAAAGQSLQEYLLARLTEQTSRPRLEDVLRRAGARAGGSVSFASAVEVLRSSRASS
jgi:plasmid stability protein